ncbi:MAG: hypothetical protein GTN99_03105, partial [Candidatus Dadabacteria bacterium]|nr:hypothetical protein [Candidatus Dadabacteria bacterium]
MIIFDIIVNKTNPVISFNALQHESYLNEFMVKRFDEQWWREREAGVKLNKWWNECSHLTPKFFEQEIVKDTPNITLLISNLEKVF